MQRITRGIPTLVAQSRHLGLAPANETINLTLVLPLRNEQALGDLLQRLYTPGDPAYGRYLTPQQFAAQFGPSADDYAAVVAWAKSQGLTVTHTYSHRKMVDVSGTARVVGHAFGVQLHLYEAPDGRVFRAPTSEALAPSSIARRLSGLFGLDNARRFQPHYTSIPAASLRMPPVAPSDFLAPNGGFTGGGITPHGGPPLTGPSGGLSPYGIQTAYDLTTVTQTGTGQVLGLLELDGYTASDITTYEQQFNITPVPLQNILIDGVSGKPTTGANSGAPEVTLDIELMTALAPGAKQIRVYEGPNTDLGVLHIYQQIATENLANVSSTSWGEYEGGSDYTDPVTNATFYQIENAIFQQMAAQGQSIFAASADDGSQDWPDRSHPSDPINPPGNLYADDPASQPYMTGVGGTTLTADSKTGAYISEKVWNNSSGASGGGISALWNIPVWQQGVFSTSLTNGSATMRNVPDVALDGDPYTGYAICYKNAWTGIYGGTSCAAPLWAAFTALVNQARVADNCPTLGLATPPLYYLATFNHANNSFTGPNYTNDFHDITSGNNNVANDATHYPAVKGYDDATGWGSFDGAHLWGDLVSMANTGTLTQLIGNPGFEQGDGNIAPWTSSANVVAHSAAERARTGRWNAWLCGYGTTHTDTLAQTVRIPALATSATLLFWLHIDTEETTTTLKNDTLTVELRDTSGNVLQVLAIYSNLDHFAGYLPQNFPLSVATYAGQTVQVYLIGSENGSLRTSFVVDDFSFTITE
jgi:kumamolisin